MFTEKDWEELNRVLDNMTDEEFEQALIDAGIENCPEISEEDKGFEIKCLNCGSTNCDVDQKYSDNVGIIIVCLNCGQEVNCC